MGCCLPGVLTTSRYSSMVNGTVSNVSLQCLVIDLRVMKCCLVCVYKTSKITRDFSHIVYKASGG